MISAGPPITRLARFVNGYPFKPDDLGVEGLPVIRIRQLLDSSAEPDRATPPARAVRIDNGDLVFSWSGSLAVRKWDRGPALLNQHLFRVDPAPNVDRFWLAYVLQAAVVRLEPLMHGSAMTHLTRDMLQSVTVTLVPPSEQRRIADFLDRETARIDALIDKKRWMLDLLNERWRSRLHATMPSSYDAGTVVKRVATLAAGGTPAVDEPSYWAEDGTPWVTIGDMSATRLVTNTQRAVTAEGRASARLRLAPPGTVLFAMYASVGAVSRLGVEACWNQALLGIRGVRDLADDDFIEFWLSHLRPSLHGLVRANTQSNLNAEQVGALPFPTLSVHRQLEIVARLHRVRTYCEDATEKLRRQIERLEEHRQALITHAVTGQLPIPA